MRRTGVPNTPADSVDSRATTLVADLISKVLQQGWYPSVCPRVIRFGSQAGNIVALLGDLVAGSLFEFILVQLV